MCGSVVNIQSATAEIRRGKEKNKLQDENIMAASATQGGQKMWSPITPTYTPYFTLIVAEVGYSTQNPETTSFKAKFH